MSFQTDANELTIGNPDTSIPIHIGKVGDQVRIAGLPFLQSSFAQFITLDPSASTYVDSSNSYYTLPLDTSHNIVIQWGFVPDVSWRYVHFQIPYNSPPYMFATKYNNGPTTSLEIVNVTETEFRIDTSPGETDEAAFNWIAIGVKSV